MEGLEAMGEGAGEPDAGCWRGGGGDWRIDESEKEDHVTGGEIS